LQVATGAVPERLVAAEVPALLGALPAMLQGTDRAVRDAAVMLTQALADVDPAAVGA